MGKVYAATDSRLGRTVAVKVLSADSMADPARLQRFEQEARAVGALNHPNVLAVYDVGREGETPYLVTELLEGDTLRQRLGEGPLPVRKSLEIASQVARGLAAAHERGVVHRDLKPENVFVTRDGTAKILDFGLAKLVPRRDGETPAEGSGRLTEVGQILGTVGYMAPEQVRGEAVDAAADVFAFGAILFEMLTGETAFQGETPVEILHAVLRDDPMPRLEGRVEVPTAVVGVVRRCLEKDAHARFRSMHDLAFTLQSMSVPSGGSAASVPAPARARRFPAWSGWIAAAVVAAALVAVRTRSGDAPRPEARPMRFQIALPTGASLDQLDFSPDGRRIVVGTRDRDGTRRVWLRDLESLSWKNLGHDDDEAAGPRFSPDGREILMGVNPGRLVAIDAESGARRTICDSVLDDASWGSQGAIVFCIDRYGPLMRVPASGGIPETATELDVPAGQLYHDWPAFLPDGRRYLFRALCEADAEGKPRKSEIFLGRLGAKERVRVLDSSVNAVYVPPGFLVHQRGDTLLAQSFDADEERVTGEPVLLATGLGYHLFAVSAAGHVAFLNSAGAYGSADLAWYDRSGKRGETVADPDDTGTPCLSRDGRKLLVRRRDFAKSETDLWCVDLDRGGKQRLTVNAYPEPGACWSPDGRRVAFAAVKGGGHVLTVRAVDGSAPDVALVAGAKSVFDWSPDGEWISFAVSDPGVDGQGRELARSRFVRADGVSSEPVREIASCGEARFSPDGRHVAYENLESGQTEVCVCSFPALSGRQQISTNGGVHPVWSADGRELFYGAPDNELMSVAVADRNGDLHADIPQALFSPRDVSSGFCVSPDGKRFLFRDQREADATPLTVILNATSLMRR